MNYFVRLKHMYPNFKITVLKQQAEKTAFWVLSSLQAVEQTLQIVSFTQICVLWVNLDKAETPTNQAPIKIFFLERSIRIKSHFQGCMFAEHFAVITSSY